MLVFGAHNESGLRSAELRAIVLKVEGVAPDNHLVYIVYWAMLAVH